MELIVEFWFLFPISILVATIAVSSGIGGAVFFSPLFMLILNLSPKLAIGTALITGLFGFTSGTVAYFKTKLIDYKLAFNLLFFSVPSAIIGSLYAGSFPPAVLKTIFAAGLIFIGYQMFSSARREDKELKKNKNENKDKEIKNLKRELTDKNGRVFHYTIHNLNMGRLFAIIGGIFLGMISVGLAELQEYYLVAKCKVPTPVAVASSVFVVMITLLFASAGHFYGFFIKGGEVFNQMLSIVTFTIPGVIIGGQIGPTLQMIIPEEKMKAAISILFVLVGFFILCTLTQ